MNNDALVTVQMPVFNGARHLNAAIKSILAQTYTNFEFLIIDDGSTDNSLELLKSFEAIDGRIKLISRENRGLGQTQFQLATSARGTYIAQLDQDDVAHPDRLAKQVNYLIAHPEVVCVGSAYQIIDEHGRLLTALNPPTADAEIQLLNLKGHCAILHPSAMMRKNALDAIGGYNPEFNTAVDIDLWLRLGEFGKLANMSDILVKYRLHKNSASELTGDVQRMEARLACERAAFRRGIAPCFEAHYAWRPTKQRDSQYAFMIQYGWWAWNSKQRVTAMRYAAKAIQARPFFAGGWKLLIVAIVKFRFDAR
jgi:glycosyltransferase involved in cell wall biosynthesis